MSGSGGRRAIVCVLFAAAIGAVTHAAAAFELKQDSHGQPLHWGAAEVSYVIDPSVEKRISGGSAAVTSAVGVWSSAGGAPALSTSVGPGGAQPGLDGQNSVILAPDGYAPAGQALAVTVTSYDDDTGAIVDSDIVINGVYTFAVLDASERAASGTKSISTDGAANADGSTGSIPFDIVHVASHEVGHTLGLADEDADPSALMYAFTMPDDASIRAPSSDDILGVTADYQAAAAPGPGAGCGQSSVAGSRTRRGDAWAAMLVVGAVGLRVASRRRARTAARVAVPGAMALLAWLAWPGPAHSAMEMPGDAVARVANLSTSNHGGLFETTLELVPSACRHDPCPQHVTAHAWGGTLGGITQRIGVGVVPSVGDSVDIAFLGVTQEQSEAASLEAAVIAVRH